MSPERLGERESAWERACRESRSIGSFPLLIRSVPRVHRYISVTFSNRPHFRPGYKQGSMADVAQGGSTRSVWSVCSIRLSCKFHNETNNTFFFFFFLLQFFGATRHSSCKSFSYSANELPLDQLPSLLYPSNSCKLLSTIEMGHKDKKNSVCVALQQFGLA